MCVLACYSHKGPYGEVVFQPGMNIAVWSHISMDLLCSGLFYLQPVFAERFIAKTFPV